MRVRAVLATYLAAAVAAVPVAVLVARAELPTRAASAAAAPASVPPPPDRHPGERLVLVGAAVFGIGLVAVLAVVLPFFFGVENRPLPLNLAAGVLPPLGLLIALVGLVRGSRATPRRVQR